MVVVVAGDDRGDAHIEVGVGLPLRVHPGKAVHQAGEDVFSFAVDDARALWDGDHSDEADFNDAALVHHHDGILQVSR